jgi:hypothetical protein
MLHGGSIRTFGFVCQGNVERELCLLRDEIQHLHRVWRLTRFRKIWFTTIRSSNVNIERVSLSSSREIIFLDYHIISVIIVSMIDMVIRKECVL